MALSPRAARLLLSAGSLVLALLLAEGVVRLAGAAPEVVLVRAGRFQLSANPRLGYEPVPDYEHLGGIDQFHDYVGRSNHLGFRDRDHAAAKPQGVYRVLVIGDSVAAGQGVARQEDIFPARLESLLEAAGARVEVLNFAVAGYHTGQEVEMLRARGLAFAPDLVLLAYCLNDTRRDDGSVLASLNAQAGAGQALGGPRIQPWLAWSALYRLAWHRWVAWTAPAAPARLPSALEADVEQGFAELAALAEKSGFRVLVVVFPRFGSLTDTYPFAAQHVLPRQASEQHGFLHLDLLRAYRRCRQETAMPLARDRYHPTAAGHDCAARAIAARILREGLMAAPGGATP